MSKGTFSDVVAQMFLSNIIPDDKNRTECVNTLRKLLLSVTKEDFLHLAEKKINKTCSAGDTICIDERNLFIDMIGADGSHDAQKLLVDLVILQPNVTEADTARFLVHCITLQEPLQVSRNTAFSLIRV